MEWEVVKVIIALLGGLSTLLGILVIVSRPNKEQIKEQKICNEKQQEVLTKLQVTIAELNVTIRQTNELDKIRDKKLEEVDERSWSNYADIQHLKSKEYKKVY